MNSLASKPRLGDTKPSGLERRKSDCADLIGFCAAAPEPQSLQAVQYGREQAQRGEETLTLPYS